jgi:hypothetical protein
MTIVTVNRTSLSINPELRSAKVVVRHERRRRAVTYFKYDCALLRSKTSLGTAPCRRRNESSEEHGLVAQTGKKFFEKNGGF